MNKEGLIKELSKRNGNTQIDNSVIINDLLETMTNVLSKGEQIMLQGFGKFIPVTRASRKTTNPHTHEEMIVEQYNTISFKPGKKLKDKVNEIQL